MPLPAPRDLRCDTMCDYENLCLETIDGSWAGIIFEAILFGYTFCGIAEVADQYLAPALETLCARWKVPEDVAGASFLAMGGAAPEIIISIVSTVKGRVLSGKKYLAMESFTMTLAISSVIGSGIIAFSLIPGLCALSVEEPLQLTRRPLARDIIAYLGSLLALNVVLADGRVDLGESACLLGLYALYVSVIVGAPFVRRAWHRLPTAWPSLGLPSPLREAPPTAAAALSEPLRVNDQLPPLAPRRLDPELGAADETTAGGKVTWADGEEGHTTEPDHRRPSLTHPSKELRVEVQGADGDAAAEKAEEGGEEEEEPPTGVRLVLSQLFSPIRAVLAATCWECEVGSPTEGMYPRTLLVAASSCRRPASRASRTRTARATGTGPSRAGGGSRARSCERAGHASAEAISAGTAGVEASTSNACHPASGSSMALSALPTRSKYRTRVSRIPVPQLTTVTVHCDPGRGVAACGWGGAGGRIEGSERRAPLSACPPCPAAPGGVLPQLLARRHQSQTLSRQRCS